MTTAELLKASRGAHRRAKAAAETAAAGNSEANYREALRLRLEAHEADPEHQDTEWLQDAVSAHGQLLRDRRHDSAKVARDHHESLVAYYRAQVGEIVREFVPPIKATGKSVRQARARAPKRTPTKPATPSRPTRTR